MVRQEYQTQVDFYSSPYSMYLDRGHQEGVSQGVEFGREMRESVGGRWPHHFKARGSGATVLQKKLLKTGPSASKPHGSLPSVSVGREGAGFAP